MMTWGFPHPNQFISNGVNHTHQQMKIGPTDYAFLAFVVGIHAGLANTPKNRCVIGKQI